MLSALLEASASQYPDHTAIVCNNDVLTYAELDRLAASLAAMLVEAGVTAGGRVGIFLPKSADAIVAIHAALKIGAAYVPILATSPAARADLIARDCGLALLIGSSEGIAALGAAGLAPCPLMQLQREELAARAMAAASPVLPPPPSDPSALAYILYTSGSTGMPKGVMISHGAARNFVDWAAACFGISHEDRLASLAPLSFDLSVFDIFAAASAGAALHLIDAERVMFPSALSLYASKHDITIWYSVPSALARLPAHGALDKYPMAGLRHILFAGEPFPPAQLAALAKALPHARLHNLYGPTETNVVTHHEVLRPVEDTPIPIGKPCAGHRLAIVDAAGRLVARGEAGELLVAGPSLMAGYCNRPDLTDAAMAVFPGEGDIRAYRTGDKVRCGEDGQYHMLGRFDDMIKTRGYRVEPGEIEAALARHPAVAEAVVLPVPDAMLGNRLFAIVSTSGSNDGSIDGAIDGRELAAHCGRLLPAYMIPHGFVMTDAALPRTDTGKLDRIACRKLLPQSAS